MARSRIYDYVFTPGTSGLGTIQVQGRVNLEDFLAIYNTTDNTCIFNFSDPALGGTVSWSGQGGTVNFPYAYAGATTLTLNFDTSSMNSTDKLSIYYETEALKTEPWDFDQDAIGRSRVSNPSSLIDADFEYGLQQTKWQNVSTTNNIPGFYEDIGADLVFNNNGYVSYIASTDTISSNVDTAIRLSNQGTTATIPWIANDYALVISQTQGNTTAFTSNYLTANINSPAERTFTLASTIGFTAGDSVVIIGRPTSGGTTTAVTNITSTATTTVNVTNASTAGIVAGTYIIVETDSAGVYEVMAVTSVLTNALTVVRQRNNSNGGNANISIGRTVNVVSSLEVAQIVDVPDLTTVNLNRGWYNIPAANAFASGSVMQKLSGNVEIVKQSAISTAVNGTQTIARSQFNSTALTSAASGSLFVRLTGLFNASNNIQIPAVGVNVTDSPLLVDNYISVLNAFDPDANGISLVYLAETNNFAYYPRRAVTTELGYPLNQNDTVLRQAFPYTGADLDVVSMVSDGNNPSTITVTTTYAHGLVPGTPILVVLASGGNLTFAEGSFFILSVPTTNTFTYQAKTGAIVTSPVVQTINVRSNAAFLPRPFDGGVIMGPGSPTRGAAAVRQTKKYFRYQSGKGLLFTSGTMLKPTFDVTAISADGTAPNSNITVSVDVEHGLNPGAEVDLSGVTTSGYNDTGYVVTSITSDLSFVVQAQNTLGSATPVLGQQPRINISRWQGSSIRAGMFDDQNGLFWECDGQSVNVVQRSSTAQLAGLVSVGVGSNLVTGDGTCRFEDQLNAGDVVVIRGMTHSVTSVLDNNRMTIVPTFRGVANQIRVKMCLRTEQRIRQNQFNIDKLDGTGPSGFSFDSTKMQMLGIEYSWYGAGYVQFMIRGQDGRFVMGHKIPNNNRNNEAYMRSGNLPGRYEAINETAISALNGAINDSQTTITLKDATDYPEASVTYPAWVMIDSEIIKYSGKSGNDLTGCTRAATLTQWVEGASRSFTSPAAASHADNTGVILISNTCVPLVNHWGSAVIMDGGFDVDQGFSFTYNRTSYGLPTTVGSQQVAFLMRLSPSVSNGIIGDLGQRDLINRSQLKLTQLTVNASAGRYLITGILNPNNIDTANTVWAGLNNAGGGFQPSFTQFAVAPAFSGVSTGGVQDAPQNTSGGFARSGTKALFSSSRTYANLTPTVVSSSGTGANLTVRLTSTGTTYSTTTTSITVQNPGTGYAVGDTLRILGNALGGSTPLNDLNLTVLTIAAEVTGGERLFAVPITSTGTGLLDLTAIKQIGQSAIPGIGTYPNGPEVLAVTITALTTQAGALGEIQLSFEESQA
jgi:hypothetical protein